MSRLRNELARQARIHKRREWVTAIVFLTIGLIVGSTVCGAIWAQQAGVVA